MATSRPRALAAGGERRAAQDRLPGAWVRTEGVPFAGAGSRFTRDFEDLVGWLATTMDKTALRRLVRIDWDTVGRIIERVMASGLDAKRLDKLFCVGVDEGSWRKGHSYITLVSDHATAKFVWGQEGKDAATLDSFFDELGEERSAAIEAMSMDMGPAYEKSARKPGHVVNAGHPRTHRPRPPPRTQTDRRSLNRPTLHIHAVS
ncbi:MAG: transposase [Acidimicrobiales bacterium]